MRRACVLWSLLWALTPVLAAAQPAYRQSGGSWGPCQPADSCVVDFGTPGPDGEFDTGDDIVALSVQAGSLIVMTSRTDNANIDVSSVTSSPTCPAPGWQSAHPRHEQGATGFWLIVWYCANAQAGVTTVTVNHSGGVSDFQMRITLDEYTGVATSSPINATASDDGPSGNPDLSGGITTTVANCLIHVSVASDGNDAADFWTPGAGYTVHNLGPDNEGSDKTMTQHRLAATAQNYAAAMGNMGDSWVIVAVAFKPSGGEPPPSGSRVRLRVRQ